MNFEDAKRILDRMTGGEAAFYADFVNEVIRKLNLDKNSKILDVGTGWGIMAIILALNGFSVLTGEPEEEAEEVHHEKHHHVVHHGGFDFNWREPAKAVGVEDKIEYQHLDAERLPFPDGEFDAIFMLDTLQHIRNRSLALQECIRVVRLNGIISILEMNENGVEYCRKEHGFAPDLVVPTDHLKKDNAVSVEVIAGELVDAYVLRKT